ncbi:CRAL-TRIO domain-containing protein [Radiomyces spectabilis]|uniref:CRAL-TRIO domain-containing protein n=1 Tax=Radiomyces spectabilis TaxID=64574 RepID=UPI00221FF3E3|nr:CRAL-TRIO domain-containing protein [Radiomyces spectabilis]KAI8388608.1 CRAL-TRIO domain-containing protein [Radiomyces spectabilis]
MDYHRQRLQELNRLYTTHKDTVDNLQAAVRREIPLLIHEFQPSLDQTAALEEYVNDPLNLFRFLRKSEFSLPHALSFLLDTLKWRLRDKVDEVTMETVRCNFLQKPLCFFHKRDHCGRPVLVVQLRYLECPEKAESMIDYLTPMVIYVLETIRKLTRDISLTRMTDHTSDPIIPEMMVMVDFKQAPSLPLNPGLLQGLIQLLRRYPGVIGMVCLINFGWMYQGIWQMCKLVLSEDAKNKVHFPKQRHLIDLVPVQDLLADLGGQDDLIWSLEKDHIYNQYHCPSVTLPSPVLSPLLRSRRSSSSSVHSVYYDASDPLTPPPHRSSPSLSAYATPAGGLTPTVSHSDLTKLAKAYSHISLHSKLPTIPLRTGFRVLGHWLMQQQDRGQMSSSALMEKLGQLQTVQSQGGGDEPSAIKLPRHMPKGWLHWFPLSLSKLQWIIQCLMIRTIKRLVRYRNTLYWIAACVLLRNGIQEFVQNMVMLTMEVLTDQPTALNAVGFRGLLGLTMGQMTL